MDGREIDDDGFTLVTNKRRRKHKTNKVPVVTQNVVNYCPLEDNHEGKCPEYTDTKHSNTFVHFAKKDRETGQIRLALGRPICVYSVKCVETMCPKADNTVHRNNFHHHGDVPMDISI